MKTFWDFFKENKFKSHVDILLAMARERLFAAKNEEERRRIREIVVGLKNLKIIEKSELY